MSGLSTSYASAVFVRVRPCGQNMPSALQLAGLEQSLNEATSERASKFVFVLGKSRYTSHRLAVQHRGLQKAQEDSGMHPAASILTKLVKLCLA